MRSVTDAYQVYEKDIFDRQKPAHGLICFTDLQDRNYQLGYLWKLIEIR